MKTRKLTAGIAAIALSFAAISAPQAIAAEPGTEPVTNEELKEGLKDISFESHDGAYITPGETLTLTADRVAEGVEIRNAYIEIAPGKTSALWDVKRSVNDEGLPVLEITAPDEPEKQFGTTQEYGEYKVHIRTSNWNSYLFNINFAEEKPKKEFELSSELDFKELLDKASSSSK
ncbi:hypothetical protein NYP18_14215 [Corynebacterium sp. YIM 101645]|uniref:Secreted protein n=1 Tax=Corynebacterium lemuris TaxID=1859292 RepID=A0ABT2FZW3_9CORY|nr:hypothetical protein [Corynebacterium lemuris]MCS5480797.1 hypothetical protein [Corynebacterium lemuris]